MRFDEAGGEREAQLAAAMHVRDGEPQARKLQAAGKGVGRSSVATHRKAQEQARLSDTGIADQHENKEVIICGTVAWARQHVSRRRATCILLRCVCDCSS